MKKFLLFLFLLLFSGNAFAQLDTEHWFAPMMTRIGFYPMSVPQHALYFSTNETTPFKVTIYSNNKVIGDVTISRGNPQRFTLFQKYIITEDEKELFKTSRLGVYTKAEKPYYANLRFSISAELGFISSKGRAALGTQFYAVVAPIRKDEKGMNFMTSVLATEDNTTVTVSGYDDILQFSTPQTSTIKFKLDKGESYIIDGDGFEPDNYDGFIGAKIVADKPISITNGNYDGSYPGGGQDIFMDQGVPVERLGNEFALVKGEGTPGNLVENALVVATQNNTEVYVNDSTVPIATLNEGQYYIIPENYYTAQNGNLSNMYIKSTKGIYLYQLFAGSNEGSEADTGDLTYIPPLNCFLPKMVGEIGTVNENPGVGATGRYIRIKKTKLNIITQTGADIKVNGVIPLAIDGPYSLVGNPDWVTYSIQNIKGNITVTSTKAVMMGIIGGDGISGFGGFFAGVSSVPVITKKGGSCVPGIILETNSDLDSYQWQLNGVDIPGATTYTYTPTQSGNYTVLITRGSCSYITAPMRVLNCVRETTENVAICQLLVIQPQFTTSPQNPDPKSVIITKEPERGTVSVDNTTGVITYTPYPRVYGIDVFAYKFCGLSEFEDCEEVTINVDVRKLSIQDDTLLTCNVNGVGIFNLTFSNQNENLPVTKTYYKTFAGAQTEDPTQIITNIMAYTSPGEDVFVLVKTPDGCSEIGKITLAFLQGIDPSLYNGNNCDDNFDGIIQIKLSDITRKLLPSSSGLVVRYYSTDLSAQAGLSNNLPEDYSYTVATTIYMRIESSNCPPIILPINLKIGTTFPLLKSSVTVSNCSYDIENNSNIDLSSYISEFTIDSAANIKYYISLKDAQNQENEINNPVEINSVEIFYIRFSKITFCPAIGILTLNLPRSSKVLKDKRICAETKALLDAVPVLNLTSGARVTRIQVF